jgi:hypothetical protein
LAHLNGPDHIEGLTVDGIDVLISEKPVVKMCASWALRESMEFSHRLINYELLEEELTSWH